MIDLNPAPDQIVGDVLIRHDELGSGGVARTENGPVERGPTQRIRSLQVRSTVDLRLRRGKAIQNRLLLGFASRRIQGLNHRGSMRDVENHSGGCQFSFRSLRFLLLRRGWNLRRRLGRTGDRRWRGGLT